MTAPEDVAGVAETLSEAQRHFVLMSSDMPMHPYDIDVNGMVAKSMVGRGLAYRTVCTVTVTDEQFNGYGLTPDGLALKAHLLASEGTEG